jgi:hypothetical protein
MRSRERLALTIRDSAGIATSPGHTASRQMSFFQPSCDFWLGRGSKDWRMCLSRVPVFLAANHRDNLDGPLLLHQWDGKT